VRQEVKLPFLFSLTSTFKIMDTGTIVVTVIMLAMLVLPFYAAQRSKRNQK